MKIEKIVPGRTILYYGPGAIQKPEQLETFKATVLWGAQQRVMNADLCLFVEHHTDSKIAIVVSDLNEYLT